MRSEEKTGGRARADRRLGGCRVCSGRQGTRHIDRGVRPARAAEALRRDRGVRARVPWGTNGLSISGEAEVNGNGPAQEEYENRAFPAQAISHAQTVTAILAAKAAAARSGPKLSKWRAGRVRDARGGQARDPTLRRAHPVVGPGQRHGGRPPALQRERLPALHRRRRRRCLDDRKRPRRAGELEGDLQGSRHDLDRDAPDRSDRPNREHALRRHRRAERSQRERGGARACTSRRTAATAGRSSRAASLPRRIAGSAGSRSTRRTRIGSSSVPQSPGTGCRRSPADV